jgi:hypothetical protein
MACPSIEVCVCACTLTVVCVLWDKLPLLLMDEGPPSIQGWQVLAVVSLVFIPIYRYDQYLRHKMRIRYGTDLKQPLRHDSGTMHETPLFPHQFPCVQMNISILHCLDRPNGWQGCQDFCNEVQIAIISQP